MGYLNTTYQLFEGLLFGWWPWLDIWNDTSIVQFFLVYTFMYIFFYNNIYYNLLCVFVNFFLVGVYLSIFQIELFTAFLWLVECSVLFIFLLLLFFLNIKGVISYTHKTVYYYITLSLLISFIILNNPFYLSDSEELMAAGLYGLIENYYESLFNNVTNDLFGITNSYYLLNGFEFLIVGLLLLVGSVVCVNLYQFSKNVRAQNYDSFLKVFNFFTDFSSFYFLRRQNLIKQGNSKASLKIFKKK